MPRSWIAIGTQGLACGIVLVACGAKSTPAPSDSESDIERIICDNQDAWLALPGVVGVGQGECDGRPCIKVLVEAESTELRSRIPEGVEGIAIRLETVGSIDAQEAP